MQYINRSAVILVPKQKLVDWLHGVPDPPTFITLDGLLETGDHNLYLIPEVEDLSAVDEIVGKLAPAILRQELGSWYTDENTWPKRLDLNTLKEFFNVVLCSTITDTGRT